MEVGDCALCKANGTLEESHLIPKFVGRWLKKTSATGRLRAATNANVALQDLPKKPLLCGSCEDRFEKYETQFSREVFYPYVEEELDGVGLKQYASVGFSYGEWMLQFLMSLQWRCLAWERDEVGLLNPRHRKLVEDFMENARGYLLGHQGHTGQSETHVLLFENLLALEGSIPGHIHPSANTYLLRATDSTIVWADGFLGVFTKLGPIGVYTSLEPQRMSGMPDTRIRRNGLLTIEQRYLNRKLVQFLLTDRPTQAYQHYRVSASQQAKINEMAAKDMDRARNSLSFAAWLGDQHVAKQKDSPEE